MLYRTVALAITAFWLVMMTLLVRLETHPDATDILDVPVSYVARIIFKYNQRSLLIVTEGEERVGSIYIRPSITGRDGRMLEFSGAMPVPLPTGGRDRVNFSGTMEMDAALRLLDFHIELNLPGPRYRLEVKGNLPRKILACDLSQGGQAITSLRLPMDAASLGPALMQGLGLDPRLLPIAPGALPAPSLTARETEITVQGAQLEVYQVTLLDGSATVADIYVTQLGQVILAKTGFGYTLAAEGYQ